jgi:hypothetical protein
MHKQECNTLKHGPTQKTTLPADDHNRKLNIMEPWTPITLPSLEALVSAQVAECSRDLAERFKRWRVPLRAALVYRQGKPESVFVVAQRGRKVVYYEDVEEGFNVSDLSADGSISTPGFEQWDIAEAAEQLLA